MTLADFVALLDDLTAEDWAELVADLPELDRALARLTGTDFQRLLADQDQWTARLRAGTVPMRVTVH